MARELVQSGVPWIGVMPSQWALYRMKSCVIDRTSGAWGSEAASNAGDTICLRIADFDYSRFRFKDIPLDELTVRNYDNATIKRLMLTKGDILIEKSGGGEKVPVGRTVIFDKDYPALYANFMDRLRCSDIVTSEWMQYVLVTFYKNGYSKNYIKQTTGIQNLDLTSMLANERVPVPSLSEQKRIASFLDSECSRIDSVIEQTRASIEENKKLKQAVITQAVTKGIRPNRKMKDSGIEWIGYMPKEWELIPFRHVLHERNEKNSPVKSTERLSLSIDLGVTLYAEKTTNLDRFKDDFEQYKLAHTGDLVMNSMNMIVGASGVSSYFGCVSPAYYTFYDDTEDHVTAKFCEYIFRSKTMLRVLFSLGKGIYAIVRGDDRVNTCRLKVSREDLRSIQIPLPSVNEQRDIVTYLDAKCREVDILVDKKESIIQELDNYKRSFIYEYVTGKKEVI